LEEKFIFLEEEEKSGLQKHIFMEYNLLMEITAAGYSIGKLCTIENDVL